MRPEATASRKTVSLPVISIMPIIMKVRKVPSVPS